MGQPVRHECSSTRIQHSADHLHEQTARNWGTNPRINSCAHL
ncbi:hypothetical protein PSE_4081 [Pseudovibrio sp. FO-BEG1]|nr:hypothetical protein PSE_4081 [Pseudovibrio sp. FO-BEG1]